MSSVTATIHKIYTKQQSVVITLKDDEEIVIENKNILVKFNEDGTIDEEWLNKFLKEKILFHRLAKLEKVEKDII